MWAARQGVALSILRAPGIYAEGRLPLERIKQGTPILVPEDDVFTNHIHADDLARAAVAAVFHGRANRAYNVTDDAQMKMGAWFDAVADAFHLQRPPRVTWDEAEQRIAPMLLSFMSESRRLGNRRLKEELRVRLAFPTPQAMLAKVAPRVMLSGRGSRADVTTSAPPWWDVPARMIVATSIVLLITAMAGWLGATWSGLLSTLPVYALVMGAFSHTHGGPGAAQTFLRGVTVGALGAAGFLLCVAVLVERASIFATYSAAVIASVVVAGCGQAMFSTRAATRR